MHEKLLPGLISLLLPFAAYGASRADGIYQRKPAVRGFSGDMASRATAAKVKQPAAAAHEQLAITTGAPARELIIVDNAVPDIAVLQAAARPGVDLVILNDGEDALAQTAKLLQNYRQLDAVHLVSHAKAGAIMLGGHVMDKASLEAQPQFLAALDQATRAGADLLLYGCDLASEDAELLELIQDNSHLDVAASNDLTGAVELGGDWDLEIQAGEIEANLAFSGKALKDFSAVLRPFGVKTFESWNGEYYGDDPSKDWDDFTTYISTPGTVVEMLSGTVCGDDLYVSMYDPNARFYIRSDPAGESFDVVGLTVRTPPLGDFEADTVTIYGYDIGGAVAGTKSGVDISSDTGTAIDLTSGVAGTFANIVRLRLAADNAANDEVDFCLMSIEFTPLDTDGHLTAAGGVSEPVDLGTTADTVGEAVDVFDFTLSDGGSSDGQPLTASQIVVHASGTSTDTERGQITWRLNGPDASNITGSYDAGTDTITFSGLSISVADGGNETYTINAWYNDTTGLIEGHTIILGVDGDTDLTVDANGTQMGMTTAVTNGTGIVIMILAPILALSVDDGGEYARYGQIRDYLVTVSNSGDAETSGANASSTYSAGLLAAASSWQCLNGGAPGNPAEPHCTPSSGTGAFGASIDLPIGSSLSFLVSVPVDIAAPVPVVQMDVSVTDSAHAITVSDSDIDTLVLFRDGFDVPYAAGTQWAPVGVGADTSEISICVDSVALTVNKSPVFGIPAKAGETLVDTLFAARIDSGNYVAVERLNFATAPWLRLLAADPDGGQRVSAWAASHVGASMALGLGNDGVARWLLLEGEQQVSLRLPLSNAAAEGGNCD